MSLLRVFRVTKCTSFVLVTNWNFWQKLNSQVVSKLDPKWPMIAVCSLLGKMSLFVVVWKEKVFWLSTDHTFMSALVILQTPSVICLKAGNIAATANKRTEEGDHDHDTRSENWESWSLLSVVNHVINYFILWLKTQRKQPKKEVKLSLYIVFQKIRKIICLNFTSSFACYGCKSVLNVTCNVQ